MSDGIDQKQELLSHPMRLRLYLYVRSQDDPVGIRETQRALDVTSVSTVNWHLDKLVKARYLVKNHDNRYQLNANHSVDRTVEVPIKISALIIRNELVSPLSFLLGFLVVFIGLTVILALMIRDPLFVGVQGLISLLISTGTHTMNSTQINHDTLT